MHLTLHITTGCQLRCAYCYVSPGQRPLREMSAATAVAAIEFAARQSPGECGIVFFGGEPLLRRDFVRDVVAYCRDRERCTPTRFHFKLTTNGLELDDQFLDFAVREDISVALSLDGVREAHDRHRRRIDGTGSWVEVDRAAARLLARRPYSVVLMVVTPQTVACFKESVRYLLARGFRYIVASVHYGGDWTGRSLRELKRQYQKLASLYERLTLTEQKFYFSPFEVKLASHIHGEHYCRERCDLGRRQLSIGPDGRIYPCVQFVQEDTTGHSSPFVIGDVTSGLACERRDALAAQSNRDPPECARCAISARCNHTCGCLNWQATGSVTGVPSVLCQHERMLMPIVDRLGNRLYRRRSSMFLQKHYNAMYPLLSLIEDRRPADGSRPPFE